jgi:hypothetical protein
MEDPSKAAERRIARTSDPLVALSRLFESARREGSLDALVLADETGITIAGAGPAARCDELAAVAPFAAGVPANDTVPCRIDVVGRAAQVRRLRIDGIEVFLCAEGAAGEGALARAAEGCRRILVGQRRRAVVVDSLGPGAAEAPSGRFAFADRPGAT